MFTAYDHFMSFMTRGGYIMWPLLLLSLVSMTLAFERCWFWLATNWPGRSQWVARVSKLLRQGNLEGAKALSQADKTVYGKVVLELLAEPYSEALSADVVQAVRGQIDRFMPTLSTIITAAPMLGILGTVTGIIASFQVLSSQAMSVNDPAAVSSGIAEALLTTVAGLIVALFTLFFFNAFAAQADRTLGRFETLIAAVAKASAASSNDQA